MANPLMQLFRTKKAVMLTISFLVVFVLGFFLGREQLKYEIRSRLAEGLSAMQNALGGGQQESSEEAAPMAPSQDQPVSMKFLKKDITMNVLDQPETIDIAVEYTNTSDKDIKAFIGTITFSDLFDRKIEDVNVTYEQGIKAGETKRWDGSIEYNTFNDADKRLAGVDVSAMKTFLRVKEVIFTDGTHQTF